ncbi:MAG: glycosyltransferase family 2 protein [Acidobacteriota bacterium]|nr:glycosyltransferase family 2 protein [Blastocatellia bacterium]MDW8413489.1 glycosyltransferase family 2 protein [Acidobacteriota bacterium]
MALPISVTVITKDEERNIDRALASVAWADEIVVLDAGSSDKTVELASKYTSRVYVTDWPGFAAQKQRAVNLAKHDWILSIDADEVVTAELRDEIKALFAAGEPPFDGYYISRLNYYLGRPVKHSGWSPDYQLRLFRKQKGRWQGDYIHESVKVNGQTAYLKAKLEHYSIESLSAHHLRLDRYTDLAAEELFRSGKSITSLDLLLRPTLTFFRNYFLKFGFLDGTAGIIICTFSAYYVFLKLAKCWQRHLLSSQR